MRGVVPVAALHQLGQPGADARLDLADLRRRRRLAISSRPPAPAPPHRPPTAGRAAAPGATLMTRACPVLPISSMKSAADAFSGCPSCRDPGHPRRAAPAGAPLAFGDPIGGVAVERLLVRLQRVAVAAELGERLAQPVVGIGIGSELEQLAVRADRSLPLPAGRLSNGRLRQLPPLARGRLSVSERHGVGESPREQRLSSVRKRPCRTPAGPEGALL